ncbi:Hypothetical predicted protein [Olea europaea subsp. europaea]|uniref:Uncharacterized protein n=1 Tax=Olea europaea subsp. europaea TaxID=158383 RepID=A0A8S0UWY6_OLEEU|nr:Hypothetical predicted protein [Olea europaea subsp. europaea]
MEDAVTEIKDLVFSETEEKESVESTGGVLNNLVSNPKEEEEEEGGVVNNFISKLISPGSSPRLRGHMDSKEKGDDLGFKDESGEDLGGGAGGRGFVKNVVSSIFHQSKGGGEEKERVEEKLGVIDSLVSHSPTPLADDAVPATDEASILIHSIVHD